jgi:hypothetical protein
VRKTNKDFRKTVFIQEIWKVLGNFWEVDEDLKRFFSEFFCTLSEVEAKKSSTLIKAKCLSVGVFGVDSAHVCSIIQKNLNC